MKGIEFFCNTRNASSGSPLNGDQKILVQAGKILHDLRQEIPTAATLPLIISRVPYELERGPMNCNIDPDWPLSIAACSAKPTP